MGKKLMALGITVAVGLGSLVGCRINKYEKRITNYHGVKYTEISNTYWNGDYSSFEIWISPGGTEKHALFHYDGKGRIYISDGGVFGKRDGLADYLDIKNDKEKFILVRKRDYHRFKEKFDKADKFLAEKREEFKKYF